MPRKLERDFASANLSAIAGMLARARPNSLTRLSLESVRNDFAGQIERLDATPDAHASAALFFSGGPVMANRGIASDFAAKALGAYQDIVTRLYALKSRGALGERGVIADRDRSRLHVTGVVRGSFGFLVEDADETETEETQTLKTVVNDSTRLLATFVDDDEEDFESALGDIDTRVLQSVKAFFDTLARDSASLRVVSGDTERTFDFRGVTRAAQRANTTTVEEATEATDGLLQGFLPDRHEFELRTPEQVIYGKVLRSIPAADVSRLYWKTVSARLTRTDVFRGGEFVRSKYVMTDVREALTPAGDLHEDV